MNNLDFLPQLEEFSEDLLGSGCVDVRTAIKEASKRGYTCPSDTEIIPCSKNVEGEWVPYFVEERD
jgi:hypothetical protein